MKDFFILNIISDTLLKHKQSLGKSKLSQEFK
jgi:hypothetical protein